MAPVVAVQPVPCPACPAQAGWTTAPLCTEQDDFESVRGLPHWIWASAGQLSP